MKKASVSLLVLFFAGMLFLTGCSKSSDAKAETPNPQVVDELVWTYFTWGMIPPDTPKVQDAINEYLAAKNLGIKVRLMPMAVGDYMQRIPLILASQTEQLDLMTLFSVVGMPVNSFIQQGQLMRLDDLVAKYGQDMAKTVGERPINAAKFNGELYGIPTIKDMATGFGLLITREYVDRYNIDIDAIQTAEDVGPVMAKIKAAEPDFYPLAIGTSADYASLAIPHDSLGDNLGVLMGQEKRVVNLYETPEYRRYIELFRKFYLAGYIPRDAATKQDGEQDQIRMGTSCAHFTAEVPGTAVAEESASGHKMLLKQLNLPYATTSSVAGCITCIPNNSRHPEKAMQLMNLLYTDQGLVNLIDYGIDGIHYVKNSDGTITYPPGVTAETTQYGLSMTWQMGNAFLSHVWEGNPLDHWKQTDEFNNSAEQSPAMGFNFDNAAVITEVAACTAVVNQYRVNLSSGSVDVSVLDEFNARLKQAGLDKIIAEKQQQFDAWREANGK
jgi:putative aldouronate transport system substrate-binding protein